MTFWFSPSLQHGCKDVMLVDSFSRLFQRLLATLARPCFIKFPEQWMKMWWITNQPCSFLPPVLRYWERSVGNSHGLFFIWKSISRKHDVRKIRLYGLGKLLSTVTQSWRKQIPHFIFMRIENENKEHMRTKMTIWGYGSAAFTWVVTLQISSRLSHLNN